MPSTDDRIVAMQFDNNSFEHKISSTISSLDKLKTSLDFAHASKGLSDLTTASNHFSLHGIASALDNISSRFTAMGAVAFHVIGNIVNRAVDAGIQLGKSLSLEQVMSGFREYETNMNSIQTVLANTKSQGTTLDDVNKALDQLNEYSDQTIYNFSQMARNIGTFTAAGVDLDVSVNAIKGIANLAAISGSNAEQASSAMYQLSQALASGSVKLMDWNSIVNAGMGGEVFQKALFETGKALGTIKDVPLGTTFDQWKDAGNTFRTSLETGWLTAEVLTNTLSGFTGDLTEAQIMAMGYTQEQTKEIMEMGKTGQEAATKVKTLTQLMSTLKESVGSGWSQTFRTVFGDFEEARTFFTGLSEFFGGFAKENAEARNAVLNSWKKLGGRNALIQGVMYGFKALHDVIQPVKEAFRELFPKQTGIDLYLMTLNFRNFMRDLEPSERTLTNVKNIFTGLFSALEIGWEVLKGVGEVFKALFDEFYGKGEGALAFLGNLGEKITGFKERLVDGGVIKKFFEDITPKIVEFARTAVDKFNSVKDTVVEVFDYFRGGLTGEWTNEGEGIFLFANRLGTFLREVPEKIRAFVDKIKEIKREIELFFTAFRLGMDTTFDGFQMNGLQSFAREAGQAFTKIKDFLNNLFSPDINKKADDTADAFGRIKDRIDSLSGIGTFLGGVWDKVASGLGYIKDALGKFVDWVKENFSDVGKKIADAISKGDYDTALDTINVGLFGALVIAFRKFTNGLDFGDGILANIGRSFDALTETLQAMQSKIKAEALMKIAQALGLLTLSLIALSLIDSAALTKSFIAVGIGIAQLVVAMGFLNTVVTGPGAAAKLATLAGALILVAGAVTLLSVAALMMSTMEWEDMAKGLVGITGLLVAMSAAVGPLSKNSAGMIRAGIGMIGIATALNIMALATKSFAEMNWEEMAQGLVGVSLALAAVTLSMTQMPTGGMVAAGLGVIAIATGLNILALAVKSFAEMNWEEMAQGLVGVTFGLRAIAAAALLMPPGMALQGVGILAIAVGLQVMALAIKSLAEMSWEEMAQGLAGVAASLLILAGASHIMSGNIAGAIAIGIMAISLGKLQEVITSYSKMGWGKLLSGLGALAVTLGVLAVAGFALAPVTVVLLGLGAAILLLGGGFALIGLGASLLASAFGILATAGTQGVAVLLEALWAVIETLPQFIGALGEGLILLVEKILEAAPGIIASLSELLGSLIQMAIDNIPKLMEAFTTFIVEGLAAIRAMFPDILATGFEMLMELLRGIRDNIGEIAKTVADIITEFLDALAEKMPQIVDSVFNFIVSVVEAVIAKLVDIGKWLIPKGVELLGGLLAGLGEKSLELLEWFTTLPGKILEWLGDLGTWLKDTGIDLLKGFLIGLGEKILEVIAWFKALPGNILSWIGDVLETLANKGRQMIRGFWNGAKEIIELVKNWVLEIPGKIAGLLSDAIDWLLQTGKDVIWGLWKGAQQIFELVVNWFKDLPNQILKWLSNAGEWLLGIGKAVIEGLWNGILAMKDWIVNKLKAIGDWVTDAVEDVLGIFSPSRVFKHYGHMLGEGLIVGIDDMGRPIIHASEAMARAVTDAFNPDVKAMNATFNALVASLDVVDDINPTITPVLDLSNVERNAARLSDILGSGSTVAADLTYKQAAMLAAESENSSADIVPFEPREISFTQINNSPKPLSAGEIYKNTRNQIAMAKEELAIL